MQQSNSIKAFLPRRVSGTYAHHQEHQMYSCSIWVSAPSFWIGGGLDRRCAVRIVPCTAPSASHTRPMQRLSRPPPIQTLGAENHMLQLYICCSWCWAYVTEKCRGKNALIKLLCCIKLVFQIISRGRCMVKQPSSFSGLVLEKFPIRMSAGIFAVLR